MGKTKVTVEIEKVIDLYKRSPHTRASFLRKKTAAIRLRSIIGLFLFDYYTGKSDSG